jgi:ABC-type polysaccharide/polyol phosphate export permease
MLAKSLGDLKRGFSLWPVWTHQAYHEISSKYKRTALGSIWISGAMVATALALAIMIGGIQGQPLQVTLPYVMAGIMAFALSGSYIMVDSPEVYMGAANIIKNHAYPFSYYTLETLTRSFIVFAHNLIAFYIAMAIVGGLAVPNWTVIFGLVLVYINSFLWGSLISMAAARFRDLRFLFPFMSQIVFFLTPIFWHPTNVSGWRVALINFNPFYGLVEIIRTPMLGGLPMAVAWEQALIATTAGLVLWLIFFGLNRAKIAFWI